MFLEKDHINQWKFTMKKINDFDMRILRKFISDVKRYEIDHSSSGYPVVRMRELSAVAKVLEKYIPKE